MNLMEQILSKFTHTRIDRPPKKLFSYPHLSPADTIIWDIFLLKNPDFFNAVTYDVRVGQGITVEGNYEPKIVDMAKMLSQRRIDVLGERNGELWIVELKFDPGISLLGQLLGYKTLLLQEIKLSTPIKLFAIVNRIDQDLKNVLIAHGILFHTV
jgi:hypothetical protein